ncbi:MAG: hypothetical protein LBP70_02755 [Mycoplasmataceae bacterium]|nr:hypothetical protein [Mycoplasmataceae bacterium]
MATFKRMEDNFINFVEIFSQVQKNLEKNPDLCKTIINNAIYIVLMNIGMVFSWTLRGKNLRKKLTSDENNKCKQFIEKIQRIIQSSKWNISLPSCWWKKISAFIYIHGVFNKLKK